ncbi:hypothetical protein BDV26DRAFT_299098 [Aspergillus bertholletiae]|uniref:Uncharacterized protein n=1 Tax=Aspergillus bertholletiae TaxID=1226010 RepID=A0A5N7AML1_9EURO|nr:hypothetical protein BDV26DRAFT_299098 [Aspergillus bertholletiae]
MDHPIFQKLDGLPIIICRPHRKPSAEAIQIQKTIQDWPGIVQQVEEAEIPYKIDQALTGLPIYSDGLMCCHDSPRCHYISRTIKSMREHWRQIHGWSQNPCRGRVTREQWIQGETELRQSYILVNCQQIFPTRKGSHYIHVRGGETEPYIPVQTEQVDEAIAAVQKAVEYLQDFTTPEDFNLLLALVETLLPDSNDPVEQGVRRIWEAIERVVRKSQWTVQHTGQAIRVEAVQSEKGQTPYRPLQAYIDADSVVKHVQPWQQIVVFIARTQLAQEGKRPVYGMTPRQRKKWRQLWQTAQAAQTAQTVQAVEAVQAV